MANILIVEDEKNRSDPFENLLKANRHRVYWTDASSVALGFLKLGTPDGGTIDLLVLDLWVILRFPDGPSLEEEGFHLLSAIREDQSLATLPVIGWTFFLDDQDHQLEATFQEGGGNAFFRHPIDHDEFLRTVAELLAWAKQEEQE